MQSILNFTCLYFTCSICYLDFPPLFDVTFSLERYQNGFSLQTTVYKIDKKQGPTM